MAKSSISNSRNIRSSFVWLGPAFEWPKPFFLDEFPLFSQNRSMNKRQNFAALSVLLLIIIATAGCGSGSAKLIPVTGVVKIDGKPAANIMVVAVPNTLDEELNAPTAQALTDANGKFELFTTSKNLKGAIAGPHLVTLIDTEEERPAQGERFTKPLRLDTSFSIGGIEIEFVEGEEVVIEATGPQ